MNKTLIDIWVLSSGSWKQSFENRLDAIALLSSQDFLNSCPDNTLFYLQHAYKVVKFEDAVEVDDTPKQPLLLPYYKG